MSADVTDARLNFDAAIRRLAVSTLTGVRVSYSGAAEARVLATHAAEEALVAASDSLPPGLARLRALLVESDLSGELVDTVVVRVAALSALAPTGNEAVLINTGPSSHGPRIDELKRNMVEELAETGPVSPEAVFDLVFGVRTTSPEEVVSVLDGRGMLTGSRAGAPAVDLPSAVDKLAQRYDLRFEIEDELATQGEAQPLLDAIVADPDGALELIEEGALGRGQLRAFMVAFGDDEFVEGLGQTEAGIEFLRAAGMSAELSGQQVNL